MVNLPLDSATLEVTWTIIPILILITIAIPRLNLLCLQDTRVIPPKIRTKLISNQWNWQTEQIEAIDHLLDSEKLDELGGFESPLLLPKVRLIRIILTRRDVLHSLGVPSIGLKLDSAPGRLNSVIFESERRGLFPGSCYELCGRGHRAIPIFILIL
jgi:cytochrome c oxidase subunit II